MSDNSWLDYTFCLMRLAASYPKIISVAENNIKTIKTSQYSRCNSSCNMPRQATLCMLWGHVWLCHVVSQCEVLLRCDRCTSDRCRCHTSHSRRQSRDHRKVTSSGPQSRHGMWPGLGYAALCWARVEHQVEHHGCTMCDLCVLHVQTVSRLLSKDCKRNPLLCMNKI